MSCMHNLHHSSLFIGFLLSFHISFLQLKISNMFILSIKVFVEALFSRSGVFKYDTKLVAAAAETLTV